MSSGTVTTVEDARDDAGEASADESPSTNRNPAVVVEDLEKVYGEGADAVRAVDGVSFEVERGTVVGVLGPNGAGKTTTIKSMLGLVRPTGGTVRLAGHDVHEDPKAVYRSVGAMLEGARNVYWRLTVRENLRFFAALGGQRPDDLTERHDALLEQFGLAEKADVAVRDLSRGMKQKTSLASTLARGGDVVFLDEPTLGLDVESSVELRRELRRLVDREEMTVVLSSHDMDVVEDVCDRVIIMNEGRVIADDTVENLLELFRTQTYEVVVEEAVPEALRADLRERFEADAFERTGDRHRFHAQVTGDEFYALADRLREAGLSVVSVDAVEPDLEDVFLHVTDRARDAGDGDAGEDLPGGVSR